MLMQQQTELYISEPGKSCPAKILEAITSLNAEGRPIWKPMHMQPIYKDCDYVEAMEGENVSEDIFARGLCLPSDIKNTPEDMENIINIVRGCFK